MANEYFVGAVFSISNAVYRRAPRRRRIASRYSYGRSEFYVGLAVRDPALFQGQNTARLDLELTIPVNYDIRLQEITPVRPGRGPAPRAKAALAPA